MKDIMTSDTQDPLVIHHPTTSHMQHPMPIDMQDSKTGNMNDPKTSDVQGPKISDTQVPMTSTIYDHIINQTSNMEDPRTSDVQDPLTSDKQDLLTSNTQDSTTSQTSDIQIKTNNTHSANHNDVGTIKINIPFPLHINPELERSTTQHMKWVDKHKLLTNPHLRTTYETADFPRLVSYVYPTARGDDLDLLNDFMGWVFIIDDSIDAPGHMQASPEAVSSTLMIYLDVLDGKPTHLPQSRLMASWIDIIERFNARTSRTLQQRYRTHWREYCDGCVLEAKNNAGGITPEYDDYVRMRRGTSGCALSFAMAEAAGGFEVPFEISTDPMFVGLRNAAEDAVAMPNDLVSVRKERDGGSTDNVVIVLAHHTKCSWDEASDMARGVINGRVEQFLRLEEQFYAGSRFADLRQEEQASCRLSIENMKDWMRGSLDWHNASARYHT